MSYRMKKAAFGAAALALAFSLSALPAAGDVSAWQKAVAQTIAKKQSYPRSAIENEVEGRARVQVVIDRTGKILSYKIVQPTGQDVLDKEIPKLMERLSPLPAPPADLPDSGLTFTMPLNWALN